MIQAPAPEILYEKLSYLINKGKKGFLITGGCDPEGRLALGRHKNVLCDIKKKNDVKFAFHTRIVDEALAVDFAEINADNVLIDITGSTETLKEIYNIKNKTVEDEISSLDLLEKYKINFSPHIIMGIHYGKFKGEYNALEILKDRKMDKLVLVILMPLISTLMEKIKPPELDEVFAFMNKARELFPKSKINLGCAKPGSKYQESVERKAVDLNFNGIAFPAEETIKYCRDNGYQIEYSYICCAF